MQSLRMSLVESITNIAVGYGLALVAQRTVFPLFSINLSLSQSASVAGIFTGLSLVRSFLVRRAFSLLSYGA